MLTFLVTGFGAFPGVRQNPTLALLAALDKRRARFTRLGIALRCHILPVTYAGAVLLLHQYIGETRPDAILHFGVAGRRRLISLESVARNRANPLRADANGKCPNGSRLQSGGAARLIARAPLPEIAAAWRQRRIAGGLSRDAGDYLCNAVFYDSLSQCDAAAIGFIHIPYPRARRCAAESAQRLRHKPPTFAEIVMAAEIAVIIMARSVRRQSLVTQAAGLRAAA